MEGAIVTEITEQRLKYSEDTNDARLKLSPEGSEGGKREREGEFVLIGAIRVSLD